MAKSSGLLRRARRLHPEVPYENPNEGILYHVRGAITSHGEDLDSICRYIHFFAKAYWEREVGESPSAMLYLTLYA